MFTGIILIGGYQVHQLNGFVVIAELAGVRRRAIFDCWKQACDPSLEINVLGIMIPDLNPRAYTVLYQ